MPSYLLPYGKDKQSLVLPDSLQADWIDPVDVPAPSDSQEIVQKALDHPIDPFSLDKFLGVRSIAIAINDKTRPVPHQFLLPPLLRRLEKLGVRPDMVRLFIATGTHTPMSSDEFEQVVSEDILSRYRVLSHDCDDPGNLVHLGRTSYGTEIWVNRLFYESDLKVVVGNVEPHHFAGFSGGMKTAAIGLAGRETITHNHEMLLDPRSCIGEYEDNPIRQDIEEIGQRMGIQLALNAVLNGEKKIVSCFFGDPMAVMQAGMDTSRHVSQKRVNGKYDLVIASAGGYPKDINFYQAQKAMTYAAQITNEGGTIILVAACLEGSGSEPFEQFMQGLDSYEAVFEKFRSQGFQVGPHKALQVAMIASRIHIIVVSQLPAEWVNRWLLTPAPDLQAAFNLAMKKLPKQPRIAILPHATNTIPVVENEVDGGQ